MKGEARNSATFFSLPPGAGRDSGVLAGLMVMAFVSVDPTLVDFCQSTLAILVRELGLIRRHLAVFW